MRALITGGTGFIGTALGERLHARGTELVLLSRNRPTAGLIERQGVSHVAAGITDLPALERAAAGCEWLFHLAAREDVLLRRDPWGEAMFDTNVLGTRAVLEAARRARVKRVVVVTSVTTFGYAGDGVANDGTNPHNVSRLDSVYVWSRVQQERECMEAALRGQEVVVCGPAGIVGPGDRKSSTPFIAAFLRGRVPAVPPGGFNWMSIDDVVEGIIRAAERARSGRRYIFAHENLTYADFFARVARLVDRAPPRVVVPRTILRSAGAVVALFAPLLGVQPSIQGWDRILSERYYASARVAVEEVGLPQTPIDGALRDTVEALRRRPATRASR